MRRSDTNWVTGGIVTLVIFVSFVYGRVLSFDFTGVDDTLLTRDDAAFLENPSRWREAFSRSFFRESKNDAFYRPLVTLSFMFDANRTNDGAEDPRVFHQTNFALHILAVLALFWLALELGFHVVAALIITSMFAVHPMTTVAVAWIAGRTDVVMGLFLFVSLASFARASRTENPAWFVAHILAFGLALFAKEAALVLPAFAVAWHTLVQRENVRRIPWYVAAGWLFVIGGWVYLRKAAVPIDSLETMFQKFQAAEPVSTMAIHLGKLVFPAETDVLATVKDSTVWPGAVSVTLLVALALYAKNYYRRGVAFAALWIVAFIGPTLFVSDFLILENRLYVPLAGLLLAAGYAARQYVSFREHAESTWQRILISTAPVTVVLAITTNAYAGVFRDEAVYLNEAARTSPHLAMPHVNLGLRAQAKGENAVAMRHYRRALELDPLTRAVHNNLCVMFLRQNDPGAAERECREELRVNPGYGKAFSNLGLALALQGRNEEAIVALRRAVQVNPDDATAQEYLRQLTAH